MAAPAQDPAYLAALEWLARLHDEDATEQDRRAFAAWLDADLERDEINPGETVR